MSHVATGSVVRQLGSLFEEGSAAGLSDRQLIERFVADGRGTAGEAAFAALVARHGPMVLGVCHQLLGDAQHAEDAFQAVFLVLARKADSIRDPDLLGNWLYGVAVRTARCARQQVVRRRRREEGRAMTDDGTSSVGPPADRPAIDREQAEALHAEIDRLPASSRLAVVLCYFEGLTLDEAARRLRCPTGTLHSRLARAKEKLRAGLSQRGIILPAAALGAILSPRSASASISPLLCDTTARAAIAFAAPHAAAGGLSAAAAALAQEVLKTMLIHKLRLVALSTLALAAFATGAGYLTRSMAMKEEPVRDPKLPAADAAPQDAGRPRATEKPADTAPARMTVVGRVLGPDGKPVAGAVVDLVARPRVPITGASEDLDPSILLGRGQSDGEGRYRLEAPRTASTRVYNVFALAASTGSGLGWTELNPDADRPGAEIRLLPERPIRVRLVDVTGAPARGVEIGVQSMGPPGRNGLFDGVALGANPPARMQSWPRPAKTDHQGRATISGTGPGLSVALAVRDLRYAWQYIPIETGTEAGDKETTHALQPAKIIEGRVLDDQTGRPIPDAVISIAASDSELGGMFNTRFRADGQGHYTANPSPGEYFRVYAYAPQGQPYLVPEVTFPWAKGAVKKTLDIRVPRGVLIRGKVTEAGTNRPLPGSSIQYIRVGAQFGDGVLSSWQAMEASKDDGSFQIAVRPGKGHLLIFGPTGDYVLDAIGANRLYNDRPGGVRYYAHAIIPYEVKAGDPPRDVAVALRPGATIKGRVEGPDGQTIATASVITTLHIEPINPDWRGHDLAKVRDGHFELHGLDPRGSARISIFDAEHEWGATVEVSGERAGEELTIRLQPCGKARARFVGPDGKPVAKHQPMFEFVATPGPSKFSRRDQAELSADTEMVANVDRKHYWNQPATDAEGRVTLGSLIPGALYRITDFSTVRDAEKGAQVRKDFTVRPGETLDLGDILIEKPAN